MSNLFEKNIGKIEIYVNSFELDAVGDLTMIKGLGDLKIYEGPVLKKIDLVFPSIICAYEENKKYKITIEEIKVETN